MSMSSSVYGIKPPDSRWLQMKAVYDACKNAGIEVPGDVDEFFEYEEPDEMGVVVNLENEPCCSEYSADMANGFEIDIAKLSKDVTAIRFVNSY